MSSRTPVAILLILLGIQLSHYTHGAEPHVCIIGAGITSASASHFLSLHSSHTKISVFEKTNRVGGRIATFKRENTPGMEAGASIIAADNMLMAYFVELLNLERSDDSERSETLGLWNGKSFVFRSYPSRFRTLSALLLRYRFSLIRMKFFVKRLLKVYSKLYPVGGPNSVWNAYPSVEKLLARAPPLFEGTQRNFDEILSKNFSPRFINEMIAAITRVNYGQEVEQMNGMSGSVGLAGSGGGLWSVDGGNAQVVSGLLKRAKADVHLNTTVTRVEKKDAGYILANDVSTWSCDAVIMAVPAELANIQLPAEISEQLDVGRKFQITVATFVRGSLNEKTFGARPPDAVLTTANVQDVFTSVAKKSGVEDTHIFKVFSRNSLNDKALQRIFETHAEVLAEYRWFAYPRYAAPEAFAKFDVDPKGAFIYTSPLESAGSAMEMSAMAGANAAALVRTKLGLSLRKESESDSERDEL